MSHWKTGVKILCSKSWEGQNSMKAKIWGSKFYFFLVEHLVKILCSLKRGVKILYFFPVPWKRGVKTAEPTNQLHWRGQYELFKALSQCASFLLTLINWFVPPLKAFVTISFSFSFRSVGGIFVYRVEKSHTFMFLAACLLLIFSIFCSIFWMLIFSIFCSIFWLFSTIQFLSIPVLNFILSQYLLCVFITSFRICTNFFAAGFITPVLDPIIKRNLIGFLCILIVACISGRSLNVFSTGIPIFELPFLIATMTSSAVLSYSSYVSVDVSFRSIYK